MEITTDIAAFIFAFLCQLIASAWWLSGLSGAVKVHTKTIERLSEDAGRTREQLSQIQIIQHDLRRMDSTIQDIRKRVE